ncbi:MAG: hypothetical protein GY866_43340 [Proteobacteria bacterium]|nr:hypothetical protein [Pseudomonadota bacterium]
MSIEYSVDVCKTLESKFQEARLHRPMRVDRYDAGDELSYDATSISGKSRARIRLVVEKFVGGGFAGQVYKVKIVDIQNGPIDGLEAGSTYALKILIPPSKGSLFFRNIVYGLGFQAPFQLQTNPIAARSGALWQKFIRRGAKIRFGDERAVNDIHATFVDSKLGSCGELSDWVDGRTWRLEVDEHLDSLSFWRKGGKVDESKLGSPEYRSKRTFMHDFVDLLHEMGAHEFARQYEWSTCKSQPNCLKRSDTDDDPEAGLMAVDFRAGLALLPFLPMSPGDFKLIFKGIGRGSLVQFDRGNLDQLEAYVEAHAEDFTDMREMLAELRSTEKIYRDSVPDVAHNHFRLLFSRSLWSTMLDGAVRGWRVRNIIDDVFEKKLRNPVIFTLMFALVGLVPFLGRFVRRIWGNSDWRKHYGAMISSPKYLGRALKGRMMEKAITWHRAGRVDEPGALKTANSTFRFLAHLPASFLPGGLHKAFTSWSYLKERLDYLVLRPVRLYFNSKLREEWLRDMVAEGEKKHIITSQDRDVILSQLGEPFIQKYLKSLAVHVCTVPITQVVSVTVAVAYVLMHPEMPRSQSWAIGLGIIALFQVVPISPGSLVRGLYVLYLVIRERNFKDYNIAVFLGFFKYIGYLAFPIQMAYRYPVLARFMAGHWATEAVHIVPVFGEGGALLERWVFCLFYNWPLTIGRRIRERLEKRKAIKPRNWHVALWAMGSAAVLGLVEYLYLGFFGTMPTLAQIGPVVAAVPLICGGLVTLGGGGASLWNRIISTAVCGGLVGIFHTAASAAIVYSGPIDPVALMPGCIWRMFLFTTLSVIGALVTELLIPDPNLGK